MKLRSVLVTIVVASGCTKANPGAVCPDGVCSDPSHAFCDVDGAISGEPNACVAVSCTPGEFVQCHGRNAFVCDATGSSYDEKACSGGCIEGRGCLSFLPSNGLSDALIASQQEPDIVWPSGTRIDTDTGIVQDASGTPSW